jgi:hydroxyacylglutathione hydrolase
MLDSVDLEVVVTQGLGDCTYLLASGTEAAIVDPQRDAGRLLQLAEARGLRVRHVLETHVHNDYVSGAPEVRAATGATIAAPAHGGYAFPFTPLGDGSVLTLGEVRLVAMATPGHTPEHTSYLLRSRDDDPLAVFSGGSLIVGSAGRTDLLGPERAEELARAQYRAMRRFETLPDTTLLLPTHGAGSFCASGSPEDARTSTIGRERGSNPALRAPDEATFVREQLSGLPAYPEYYAHIAPINRAGAEVRGATALPRPLEPDALAGHLERGARLVDARDVVAFAGAHVPGSMNSPLEDSFASYVGWVVPFGTPILLVADHPDARAEASVQLFRIGYEVAGYLDGGVDAWATSGRSVASYPVATVEDLLAEARRGGEGILDVRQRTEWEAGHLPGSRHCFVGDLPARLSEFGGTGDLIVACVSGQRSAIAASLLAAAGASVRPVARDGVPAALDLLR